MEFKINIDPKQFDTFVTNHSNCHYGKTSMWGEVKHHHDHYKPVLSGLYDKEQLIATALLLHHHQWGIHYLYIPWGFCTDYHQAEIIQFYTQSLQQYAKQNKLTFIRIDPNVRRFNEDGSDNQNIVNALEHVGFIHKGYGYGYDGSWSNRYTLMIDIQDDFTAIQNRFSNSRKSAIKKHNVFSIHTEKADLSKLDVLCRLEQDLVTTKKFKAHSIQFFQTICDCFSNNYIYAISTLNLDESIHKIEAEIQSGKYAKDPEALQSKQKSCDDLSQLKEKYGSSIEIAAGLFLYANHSCWDLYLYKCSDFNFVNGTDEIHRFMIQSMKEKGITCYDMCGFSGSTDPSDPYYGLYLYKSSFGSKIIEHIGEFNLVLHPFKMKVFTWLDRFTRKVKRRINYIKSSVLKS